MAARAFTAVKQHSFGKRGRPRFKGQRGLHAVEAKTNATGIRWRDGAVHLTGRVLSVKLDPRDRQGWQHEALSRRTKYLLESGTIVRTESLSYRSFQRNVANVVAACPTCPGG